MLEEAVDHLIQDAYREALVQEDILPLTNADVEVVQAEEGKPLIFKATVPVRPDVTLGDYQHFNFAPEIEVIDDARVDQVVEELRDQNATLGPVEDRGAKDGDYAVIAFVGTRDGVPFEGGDVRADAAHPRPGAADPGLRGQPRRPARRRVDRLRHHLPRGLRRADPGRPDGPLRGRPQGAPREDPARARRRLPRRASATSSTVDELRADIKRRLEANALDRARHGFADRIIEYAVANATVELPDVLIDQEVEVMHDEFRGSLARQGITEEAYLKATEKTGDDLHAEFRPGAEKRVKTLLVLSKVADVEGVEVPDADVDAEVAQGRDRYAGDPRLVSYFESERGRAFIRSTLRRSRVVEPIIDRWLAEHPDHPPLPHLEDEPASAVSNEQAQANA